MTQDNAPAGPPPAADPAAKAQAAMLIRLTEADGCIFHGEWYPGPGAARLRYTRRDDNHDQMWEIDVRPWAGWPPHEEARSRPAEEAGR
jgi:hypothetical protein